MTTKKKHGLIFAATFVLVLSIFLYLPFPLISHLMTKPNLDDPVQSALSDTYLLLYNWWLPKLPETNPYKSHFLDHIAQLCLEHTESRNPTGPRVAD